MGLRKLFKSKKAQDAAATAPAPNKEKPAPAAAPARPVDTEGIKQSVIEILRTVYDPEIPVNIYEMGLVYGIDVDPAGNVVVRLTLTSPGCPVAASLPLEVEAKTLMVPDVNDARIVLVWDPPWDPGMMTEAARLQLGFL
jgi:FeS assembly SUF system protein